MSNLTALMLPTLEARVAADAIAMTQPQWVGVSQPSIYKKVQKYNPDYDSTFFCSVWSDGGSCILLHPLLHRNHHGILYGLKLE